MSEPPGGFELKRCQIPKRRVDAFRHVHIFEETSNLGTGVGEVIILG